MGEESKPELQADGWWLPKKPAYMRKVGEAVVLLTGKAGETLLEGSDGGQGRRSADLMAWV